MEWDSLNELLYCGEKNGQINIWNFKTVILNFISKTRPNLTKKKN
jgi:hypothetical protein